jgi:hypothetical protein
MLRESADLILHSEKSSWADSKFTIGSAVVVLADQILAAGGEDLVARHRNLGCQKESAAMLEKMPARDL